ncbi:hypothetical protein [Streptomyces sp. NPDC059460]|uniref:hypothetical protein n=1 Tax=Streptomyces sp. NPDC059460 TaxID=3346840 RepID=UPI00368FA603
MQPTELMVCTQHAPPIGGAFVVPAPPLPLVPHALKPEILMEAIALLATAVPLALVVALLCATVVCLAAICRAHRTDVVAVVQALPDLALALLRRRRP